MKCQPGLNAWKDGDQPKVCSKLKNTNVFVRTELFGVF